MTESERQTAAGRRGEPFVRVRFEPSPAKPVRRSSAADQAAQNARAARGQAATTVRFAPNVAEIKRRAAEDAAPSSLYDAFGGRLLGGVDGPIAPLARLLTGPRASTNPLTQEGRVNIREGLDLIAGNPYGGPKYPVQPDPVTQALAQGRQAAPPSNILPADRQSQMIAAILGSGLTVNEAASVTGILPAPAAGAKPGAAKDAVLGQAAKLSEQLFQSQVNQATELAKTDPVGARAIVDKATQDHFARQAGLVGFNPLQLAQAALLNGAAEEE